MLRECLFGLVPLGLAVGSLAGCSLALDFTDSAIPLDAAPDSPFTDEQCAYLEPNDSLAEAMVITPDEMGTAAICPGAFADRDFYRFTVPAGTTSVSITILFTTGPTGDLDLRLLDLTGALRAASNGFEDNENVTCAAGSPDCEALAEGDYVFEVFGVTGSTNSYTISLTLTGA